MKLRAFETADTMAVLQLANACAAFDAAMTESDLAIARSLPEGFVAEDGGRVVGFVLGYFRDLPAEVLEHWGASKVGKVELLAVEPRYRNRGVGSALIKELLRVLLRAGADIVTLHCPADAKQAKRIYDRLGFDVRAYEMIKRL